MQFAHGTLNLLKTNEIVEIRRDLVTATSHCHLLGMQENTRKHVGVALDWLDDLPGWEVFIPEGSAKSNPIAWRTSIFEKAGEGWAVKVHGGHAKVTPSRYIVCQPLRHKATGKTLLLLNAHCINAYARDNRNADALRDRLAEDYWRTVVDVTWQHREAYDVLLLSGDFNVRLSNREEPWYPGHLLKPLYRFDHGKGIDHTLVARGSDCHRVKHYRVGGLNSDHDLHVQILDLGERDREPEPEKEGHRMRLVTLEGWGSNKGRRATRSSHPIGSTKGITAHWEGPKMGQFPHSRCARLVRTIERFHEISRGWADIAYNALVCPHGYVFEGRGPGVKSAANGNSQTNDDWYAVCYLGGQGDGFTEQGKQGFLDAFAWLTEQGNAGPGRNGHRDHKATACPGDEIYEWVHSPEARTTTTETRDWFDMASPADLEKVVRKVVADALVSARVVVDTSKGPKTWTLSDLLRHIENEQDKTQALARKAAKLADPERLADLVAARINVDVTLTPDEVKQAVKDALTEGVE